MQWAMKFYLFFFSQKSRSWGGAPLLFINYYLELVFFLTISLSPSPFNLLQYHFRPFENNTSYLFIDNWHSLTCFSPSPYNFWIYPSLFNFLSWKSETIHCTLLNILSQNDWQLWHITVISFDRMLLSFPYKYIYKIIYRIFHQKYKKKRLL